MEGIAGKRVAIANRGEIAVRIARTCERLGAVPVLLLGDPDLEGYAARQVGRVERVGAAGAELEVDLVVAAARRAGADLLHPGYGFLSERAALAEGCLAAGIAFVGPSPATLRLCGDKVATREAATGAGVPVMPASQPLGDDPEAWRAAARQVGYPLLVKPSEAGGGRGLRQVDDEAGLVEAIRASRREGAASGAGERVYLERMLIEPRHIEVQVAADGERVLAVGDRDCSLQRRHQKVIEEAPAPNLDEAARRALHTHACRVAEAVGLRGIATCEFLLGADGTLAFLEVNPRIQVEHPVTEAVTGVDLVEWQLRIAVGQGLSATGTPTPRGHAIEARVYAEDPSAGFLPAPGTLEAVAWPDGPGIRVDAGYAAGDRVPTAYDAMLAKVIAGGVDRDSARAGLLDALRRTVVAGVPTNVPWLLALLDCGPFRAGRATTSTAGTIAPITPDLWPALFGAAAHALERTRQITADPWAAIGPFRLSGDASLTFHGDGWEERLVVRRHAGQWEIAGGGETITLAWWRDGAGVWTIAVGDAVARVAIVERDGALDIAGHGGRWAVRSGARVAAETDRGQQRRSDGRVRAPMPARVLRVHVAPGDAVVAGQPLVTLTAMKMELTCEAPADGVVDQVACAVDDQVAADADLVRLVLASEGGTV